MRTGMKISRSKKRHFKRKLKVDYKKAVSEMMRIFLLNDVEVEALAAYILSKE